MWKRWQALSGFGQRPRPGSCYRDAIRNCDWMRIDRAKSFKQLTIVAILYISRFTLGDPGEALQRYLARREFEFVLNAFCLRRQQECNLCAGFPVNRFAQWNSIARKDWSFVWKVARI